MDFFIINMKLLSNRRKGKDAYKDIMSFLYKNKVIKLIRGDSYGILRTQFFDDEMNCLYGKFAKFTKISKDHWIDVNSMEIEDGIEIPKNKFPNLKEISYYFFPELHRMAIRKKNDLSIWSVYKYLENSIPAALSDDEEVNIHIEQSEDIIEKLLESKEITTLDIELTPTNDDKIAGSLKKVMEIVDEGLKEGNVSKYNTSFRPAKGNKMNPKKKFIKAHIQLAKSNGTVKSTIINEEGKKEKIETDKYPRNLKLDFPRNEDDKNIRKRVKEFLLKWFR